MTAAWSAWCQFWGFLDAVVIVGLLVVAVWSAVPKRGNRLDKRTPFRACPTCIHVGKPMENLPCRECLTGDSAWEPK